MMKPNPTTIPDNDTRLHQAWGLVLPYAQRVLVIATQPPTSLVDWWRRQGVVVSTVTPGALQDASEASQVLPEDGQRPDLVVLWDVEAADFPARLATHPALEQATLVVWSRGRGLATLLDQWQWKRRLQAPTWRRTAHHLAWPDLERPRQIIDSRHWGSTPLHLHRRSQSPWKTALLQSPLGRLRVPSNLSRWQRHADRDASWLQDIVTHAGDVLQRPLQAGDLRLSPNGVAIVRLEEAAAGPVGILKVPLTERTVPRVATNARALRWMQEQRAQWADWSAVAPALLADGVTHQCSWSLEEHIDGSEAQTWEATSAQQATEHVAELLGLYQRATRRELDAPALQERLNPVVRSAADLLSPSLAQPLQEIWETTVRNLEGVRVPEVPQHGDCKLENVLGDPRRPTRLRLLDWELWRPDGLPLLDLQHLLLSRRRRAGGYSIGGSICRWLVDWDFAAWERRLIDTLAQGLDRRYVRATPVLYWLERLAPIVARGAWPNDGWVQANVQQVIARMHRRQTEVVA